MKRIILITLALFLFVGCSNPNACINKKGEDSVKLYVNGEKTWLQEVYFRDPYLIMPLGQVLLCLGGERDRTTYLIDKYHFQDSIVCIDFPRLKVYVESIDESEEANNVNDQKSSILMPTRPGDLEEIYYVNWGEADVLIDQYTLERVLNAAGITVQIRINFQEEIVMIETKKS